MADLKNKIQYRTEVQQYNSPNDLDVDSQCIDILFYNNASGTVYINGFPLAVGASLEISGNEGELNVTKYKISFAGSTGAVIVNRRKYA